jgi:type IV pilus assembly protein PilE
LIELMVTVAIIAILAGVALPAYTDYVMRGKLSDGTSALAMMRARMEQFYQDNRTYASGPCTSNTTSPKGYFTIACSTADASTYTITATATDSSISGMVYTLDSYGNRKTTGVPSAWGSVPACGSSQWVTKRGNCD